MLLTLCFCLFLARAFCQGSNFNNILAETVAECGFDLVSTKTVKNGIKIIEDIVYGENFKARVFELYGSAWEGESVLEKFRAERFNSRWLKEHVDYFKSNLINIKINCSQDDVMLSQNSQMYIYCKLLYFLASLEKLNGEKVYYNQNAANVARSLYTKCKRNFFSIDAWLGKLSMKEGQKIKMHLGNIILGNSSLIISDEDKFCKGVASFIYSTLGFWQSWFFTSTPSFYISVSKHQQKIDSMREEISYSLTQSTPSYLSMWLSSKKMILNKVYENQMQYVKSTINQNNVADLKKCLEDLYTCNISKSVFETVFVTDMLAKEFHSAAEGAGGDFQKHIEDTLHLQYFLSAFNTVKSFFEEFSNTTFKIDDKMEPLWELIQKQQLLLDIKFAEIIHSAPDLYTAKRVYHIATQKGVFRIDMESFCEIQAIDVNTAHFIQKLFLNYGLFQYSNLKNKKIFLLRLMAHFIVGENFDEMTKCSYQSIE